MLYTDYRIGGQVRYVITNKPQDLMQVPDEIRKCVVFLGYRMADGSDKYAGTAFWANRRIGNTGQRFMYLVTAKHVIDGIQDKGYDKVWVRVNFKGGEAYWLETELKYWLYHPTDPDHVDVAVLPLPLPAEQIDHITYPIHSFATDDILSSEAIGIGDEVFITGLFHVHAGERRNIPLVRVGNIAAMPEEPVLTKKGTLMDAYLIESRSIGGLSGSPVFVHLGAVRLKDGHPHVVIEGQPIFYLLGLLHGHWDTPLPDVDEVVEDEQASQRTVINMGIAMVVPAYKILEVIQQPMQRNIEDRLEAEFRQRYMPTMDTVEEETPVEGITRDEFFNSLRRVSHPTQPQPDPENSGTSA